MSVCVFGKLFKENKKHMNQKYFYQLSIEESLKQLKSDLEKGLSEKEAEKRLAKFGKNQIQKSKKQPIIFRFFGQFNDPMIILLIVAALLAYYLNDFRGGTILLVIVTVNAIIGFYQEFKAEHILESLEKMIQPKAIVIREGEKKEIDQHLLVPGDLVYLEEGSAIPADVRLIQTTHFSTNDFILTGESVPQEKKAELVIEKNTTITNQDNLAFLGVTVAKGNAIGLVYGTGMQTAIGRIASASQGIKRDQSPLEKEMKSLAKMLTKIAGVIALALFAINFLLHLNDGQSQWEIFQLSLVFAIGVAAASVPQGLPAQVSVALSLGVGRLAKRKAIIKKLSAVETLGSTTIICSDKTGTLTKNEMMITHCWTNGQLLEVTGNGYRPTGGIFKEGKKLNQKELKALEVFFKDGFLASNGRVNGKSKHSKNWMAIGDPTEAAFTPLAMKAGLDPKKLDKQFSLVKELPFDSDRKRMTMIRKHKGKLIGYMKGGIESILEVCTHINESGKVTKLTPTKKKKIIAEAEKLSQQALRVLGLAYRDFKSTELKTDKIIAIEKQFVFSGFVGMMDPPRTGVKAAINSTYGAHIRVMMITGDNPITALAIAKQIGMKNDEKPLPVFTGDDIKQKTDRQLQKILKATSAIFSRVSPEDKYRIVSLLKQMGEVVAVTGDGVNDTLSLKKADIGVAMGKVGSDVAKESSEIVLLDDNFKTLTAAIKEGRTIFANLKKTILSSITSNNGELFCVLLGFVGVAFGLPIPITAVQILAIDLVGEMLPLTALTFDPPEKHILNEPPRDLKEHIVNKNSLVNLLFYGFWMGAAGFFSFVMVHHINGQSVEAGRSASYMSIILCQYFNILSRRTQQSLFNKYLFTNKQLWGSFALSTIAVFVLIYIPSVAIWFGFAALPIQYLIYPLIGGIAFLGWHEGRKLIGHNTRKTL